MSTYTFRIIIEPDEKKTFHGYVPTLPGCHTWGRTIEETRKNLVDAIETYITSLLEDGEPIPQEQGFEFFATVTVKKSKNFFIFSSFQEVAAKMATLLPSQTTNKTN